MGLADPTDVRWAAAIESRAEQGSFRGRLRFLRGDGSTLNADVSSAIFFEDGHPCTYVLFDDASELDAALDEAARKQAYSETLVQMLDSISDGYFAVDKNWAITFVNRRAEAMLQVGRFDVLGKKLWDAFPMARDTVFQEQYERVMRTGDSATFEGHYLGTDLRCEVRAYRLDDGGLGVYFLDVGDRHAAAAEREHLLEAERTARALAESALATAEQARAELAVRAAADDLTGLFNRSGLADAVQASRIAEGARTCLLLADLDNFKLVNDTLGHIAGDRVLQAFADRLRMVASPSALLARLGGDEFAITLFGHAVESADAFAETILAIARQPLEVDGNSLTITVSIGLAVSADPHGDFGTLLREADAALYRAKGEGRDRAAWFDDLLHSQAVERVSLEQQLRSALAADLVTAHFQACFDLRTSRTVDVEALARWTDPLRGPVSPAVFVPVAEESGLIHALGDRMLAIAVAQASRWASHDDFRVWVNVSPRQLATTGLADRISALLGEAQVPAERFGIEVTESSLIDERRFVDELQAIHALGVGLAIDDFGTGYSSLARLARMPVDLVKIDRSFVIDATSAHATTLIEGIVTLGHALGARVTAEGVETEEQLQRVVDAGCDSASGYLLQRPVEPRDLQWFSPEISRKE